MSPKITKSVDSLIFHNLMREVQLKYAWNTTIAYLPWAHEISVEEMHQYYINGSRPRILKYGMLIGHQKTPYGLIPVRAYMYDRKHMDQSAPDSVSYYSWAPKHEDFKLVAYENLRSLELVEPFRSACRGASRPLSATVTANRIKALVLFYFLEKSFIIELFPFKDALTALGQACKAIAPTKVVAKKLPVRNADLSAWKTVERGTVLKALPPTLQKSHSTPGITSGDAISSNAQQEQHPPKSTYPALHRSTARLDFSSTLEAGSGIDAQKRARPFEVQGRKKRSRAPSADDGLQGREKRQKWD